MAKLQRLVQEIGALFGSCSSLTGRQASLLTASNLITIFKSNRLAYSDWLPYAFRDKRAPYTRNLIARLPNDSKLMILVWSPGQQSAVHSHANTHCVMKMLKGRLSETLYAWPSASQVALGSPLTRTGKRTLEAEQVSYMADEMGLHRIENPDKQDYAVSMHLYVSRPELQPTPVELFDERTGSLQDGPPMKLHSEGGLLLPS